MPLFILRKFTSFALLLFSFCIVCSTDVSAQTGMWAPLTTPSPHYNEGVMLLLTDGTVICKTSSGGVDVSGSENLGNVWDRLTPVNGSYINGTWSSIAAMDSPRLYFSSQVLRDGRVYVCGGEYGGGGKFGEIYNPRTNTWAFTGTGGSGTGHPFPNDVSDANSEMLPDGTILQASVDESGVNWNYIYDPIANTYTRGPNCLGVDNEAVWVKLPDNSVLFMDNYNQTSERYIPATNTWIADATAPENLFDPYGFEAGAAFLLPNGKVWFIGSLPNTLYYTPSGTTAPGTWTAGPSIPIAQGAPDASATMLPNGHVLLTLSPTPSYYNHFPSPTSYYEFDYTTNSFTPVGAPEGGTTTAAGTFISNMLVLPDGNVLFCDQGNDQYYVYTPGSGPLPAGKPAIATITRVNCDTFQATGTLFNGISEGAAYGDDWQMNTNFPIVRLTDGANIYYATTYNWNRIGAVATGSLPDTCIFQLPAGLPVNTYSVTVIANGNPSAPFTINTGIAISPSGGTVTAGSTITLSDAATGGTWSSASSAVATVASTGVVTGTATGTTHISYAISGGCYSTVVVTVTPNIAGTITGTLTVCSGATTVLTDLTSGGTWSSGNISVATVGSTGIVTGVSTGTATISYTISGISATTVVTVNPLPAPITGISSVCSGATTPLSDATPAGVWSSTSTANATISGTGIVTGVSAGTTTISYTATTSCGSVAATMVVTVQGAPSGGTITGATAVLAGNIISLSDAVAGGTWSSGATGIAIVNTTGQVTGVSPGTALISYSVTTSCGSANATIVVTVSLPPCASIISTIAGNGTVAASGDGGTALMAAFEPHDVQIDAANNIYIVDRPNSRIRKINTSGIITTVAGTGTPGFSGDGGAATAATMDNPNSMVLDKFGNMYISDGPNNVIRKVSAATGIITTIAGTGGAGSYGNGVPATTATFNNPYGIAVDTAGNVYIGDSYNNLVRKINASGIITTIAGTGAVGFSGDGGPATAAKLSWPTDIAVDYAGNIFIADGDNNRIRVINTTGIISTVVGSGAVGTSPGVLTGSFSGDGGPATNATINLPFRIQLDHATSNLYIADDGNNRIRVVNAAGIISTLAGNGTGGFFGDLGPATAAEMSQPAGVALDNLGNFYIADWGTDRIRKVTKPIIITPTAGPAVLCAGTTATLTATPAEGTWTSASTGIATIGSSTGIVTGISGGTALISYSIHSTCGTSLATTIITVNPAPFAGTITASITVVGVGSTIPLTDAVTGGVWSSGSPSIATVNTVGIVTGVAVGTALISYTVTNSCGTSVATDLVTVELINSCSPIITTIAGIGIAGRTGDGGPATAAEISYPDGLALFGNNLYIGNVYTNCVRKIDLSTGIITTFAGTGVSGYSGNGGPATAATLTTPYGVSVDTAGNVYICDEGNDAVRKVNTSGIITTVAGTGYFGYGGDGGPATAATISDLNGVAPDRLGNLYIADQANYCVRKVNSSGIITNVAGIPLSSGYGGDGGPATAALFQSIPGVDVDTAGNIYVDDLYNHRLRKINPAGVITTIAGTGVSGYSGDGGPATAAKIYGTVQTYMDRWGNIFFGDTYNNVIREITTAGIIYTIAGSGSTGFSGDGGLPTLARIGGGEVVGDRNGHLYICDYSNQRIRKVTFPPSVINGAGVLCLETTLALSDSIEGGVWSSGSPGVASIGSASGVVFGNSAGTAAIYYTANGCTMSRTVTVNGTVTVGPIFGTTVLCAGTTTMLSDVIPGGTWSSSATGIATIGSSGLVTGISSGTATISYTATSCGTSIATQVVTVGVSAAAGVITGVPSMCSTATTSLSDVTSGGVWSSDAISIATVGSTGIVTGVSSGTTIISYTVVGSCGAAAATKIVTVNASPFAGSISGTVLVCPGVSMSLSDPTGAAGGSWSSAATGIATVGSSGLVTGVSGGTATISYAVSNSCGSSTATQIVTINPLPSAGIITGTLVTCDTNVASIGDTALGGTWSSTATGIATVGSTGLWKGVAAGTATISYTVSNGCGLSAATRVVTVNTSPDPGTIHGTYVVCAGASTLLSDAVAGGTWSTSLIWVATVGSSGQLTGIFGGTATISYTVSNSCGIASAMQVVTIDPLPVIGTIAGTAVICGPSTTSLSDPSGTAGGVWSSTVPGVATIGYAGSVNGVSAGTTTISYTVSNSCGLAAATQIVTVNALPNAGTINGAATLCAAASTLLSDIAGGGVWSSTVTGVAGVGSTGLISGVSAGTATISYTVTNSCGTATATKTITVNPLADAGAVMGASAICAGSTTSLSDPSGALGGTWSSTAAGTATVGSAGLVNGISAGTATISYTVVNSCGAAAATQTMTINALPDAGAITGTRIVCETSTLTLSDIAPGGAWSSGSTGMAIVGSDGTVTGVAPGTATISYQVSNICGSSTAVAIVTVNPSPGVGAISGIDTVCVGSETSLSDTTGGGIWITSDPDVATIGTTGLVAGISVGTTTISYTVTNYCGSATVTTNMAVISVPDAGAISGTLTLCAGSAVLLSDNVPGGVWASSNVVTATVNSAGIVSGLMAGTAEISYSVTNGCGATSVYATVTINPLPDAGIISGLQHVCVGESILLADAASGTWSSSATNIAIVSTTGMVSGLQPGTDTITYSVAGSNGCRAMALYVITVTPLPANSPITGPDSVCIGAQIILTDAAAGGTWSSNNTSLATVGSGSGSVIAVSTGQVIITYTLSTDINGCVNDTVFTLTINTAADFDITGTISNVKCYGGSNGGVTVAVNGGTGPFKYLWSNGDSSAQISNLLAAVYLVQVKDISTQCSLADSLVVTQPDSLHVAASITSDRCKSGNGEISLTVSGGITPYQYLWSGGAATAQITNLSSGVYTVAITDANNCVETESLQVAEDTCADLVVHTGITPNGDGENDLWVITGIQNYPNNTVQLFDKWGDMVYEQKNYNNDWHGQGSHGEELPSGTYFYLIKLNGYNQTGGKDVLTGSLLLKR